MLLRSGKQITGRALSCLQIAIETFLISILEDCNLAAIHRHHTCVKLEDLALVMHIRYGVVLPPGPAGTQAEGEEVPSDAEGAKGEGGLGSDSILPTSAQGEQNKVEDSELEEEGVDNDTMAGACMASLGADAQRKFCTITDMFGGCNTTIEAEHAAKDIFFGTASTGAEHDWNCCSKLSFSRLVRGVAQDASGKAGGLRFEKVAIQGLQALVEVHLQDIFRASFASAKHAKRLIIEAQDIQFARRIRGERA